MRRWLAVTAVVAVAATVAVCTARGPQDGAAVRGSSPAGNQHGAADEGAAPTSPVAPPKPGPRVRAEPVPTATATPPESPPTAAGGGRAVVVRVQDPDGTPHPAAIVWEQGLGPRGMEPTTGADGSLRLTLTPGRHTIVARGRHTRSVAADVDVPAGDGPFSGPTITLDPGGVIRGRVVDERGGPLAWIRVRCWEEGDDAVTGDVLRHGRRYLIGGDDVLTDAQGEFALRGLEAAPHEVFPDLFFVPGLVAEPPKVGGVRPGSDLLQFRLVPFASVTGRVVDAESRAPVARFEIEGGPEIRDAEGRFRRSVAPGEDGAVTLEIRARGRLPATLRFPGVTRGAALDAGDVALESDADTGTLVIACTDPSGNPVGGLRIDGTGPDFRTWTEVCDGATGRARADGLGAGEHAWWAYGDGFSAASGKVAVAPGEERALRVVVARAGSVRLRMLAADGRPEAFVEATVLDGGRVPVPFRFVFARPQGTLHPVTEWCGAGPLNLSEVDGRLCGLAPGRYTLRLATEPFPTEVAVTIPETGETEFEFAAAK